MFKGLILSILILFIVLPIQAQSVVSKNLLENQKHGKHHLVIIEIDSILNTNISDSLRIEFLRAQLYSFNVLEEWTRFKENIDHSLAIGKKLNRKEAEFIEEYIQIQWYYQSVRNFAEALKIGKKAIAIAKGLPTEMRLKYLPSAFSNFGYTHSFFNSLNGYEYYDSALLVLQHQKILDTLTTARVYHNMGNHYNNYVRHNKMTSFRFHPYKKSLTLYQQYNDSSKIALNYYVQGFNFDYAKKLDSAEFYFQKSVQYLINKNGEIQNSKLFFIVNLKLESIYFELYCRSKQTKFLLNAKRCNKQNLQQLNLIASTSNFTSDTHIFFSSYPAISHKNFIQYELLYSDLINQAVDVEMIINEIGLFKNLNDNLGRYCIKRETPLIQQISASLDDETLVLDFYENENDIYLIKITSKKKEIISVSVGDDFWDNVRVVSRNEFKSITEFQQIAHSLFKKLIPSDVNVYKNVIIIPDEETSLIPFESLISKKLNTEDYRNLNYFINTHSLQYLSSLGDFYQEKKKIKGPLLVLMAKNQNKNTLLFSEQLSEWINETYENVYLLNSNQKNSVIDDIISNEMVHILGHSFDIAKEYELTHGAARSENGLSSDFNKSSFSLNNQENLQILDFNNKDLSNVKLMILQGCESGSGIYFNLNGRYSLAKTVLGQGVKGVISAIWEIDDQFSSIIMKNFYINSEYYSGSAALNVSKRNFIQTAQTSNVAHPKNWSGIRYTGSDVTIKFKPSNQYSPYIVFLIIIALLLVGILLKKYSFFKKGM